MACEATRACRTIQPGLEGAFVAKGLAGPGPLSTYNTERQPVGAQLVREANLCLRIHMNVGVALGTRAGTQEERKRIYYLLTEASPEGEAQRRILHEALEDKMGEGKSLGLCMNPWYESSAVYLDDEAGPRDVAEGFDRISMCTCRRSRARVSHMPGWTRR